MRLGDRLLLHIAAQAHPAAHLTGCTAGKRQPANTPAHCQMPHELRDHALDERQFLAVLPMLHLWRWFCLYLHLRWTRSAEAALYQGHHLALLHRPAQHLADSLALAQYIDFKTDRHVGFDRADKGDRQRAHRPVRRHLGAHGFVLQGNHQAAETGAALRPSGRDRQFQWLTADSVEQIAKAHEDLKKRKKMRGS
ncbi:hypothetical protein D9M71_529890 [compost metagenome]